MNMGNLLLDVVARIEPLGGTWKKTNSPWGELLSGTHYSRKSGGADTVAGRKRLVCITIIRRMDKARQAGFAHSMIKIVLQAETLKTITLPSRFSGTSFQNLRPILEVGSWILEVGF